MLKKLQQFFQNEVVEASNTQQTLQIATAALLLEVVYADQKTTEEEKTSLKQLLIKQFDIDADTVSNIIQLAEDAVKQASGAYEFTRLVNDNFNYPERCQLIKSLWEIAKADGHIDKYEEYTIRKISDLIFVDHSDYIRAKLAVFGRS
jgi:uncharacterized tellurite resistance protein B-like protein